MRFYEINRLCDDLAEIEEFFIDFAARQRDIEAAGFSFVASALKFEAIKPKLDSLPARLEETVRFAKFVDAESSNKISKLIEENNIAENISMLVVNMSIESRRKLPPDVSAIVGSLVRLFIRNNKRSQLFSEETVPVSRLVVTLKQISTLINVVQKRSSQINSIDDEIFKPSKVDNYGLAKLIEGAIDSIRMSRYFPDQEKKKIVEYLESAEHELGTERPAWKKILGVLMITAALTSGISDAKQAYLNISEAIHHIIDISVEQYIAHAPMLTAPDAIDADFEDLDSLE